MNSGAVNLILNYGSFVWNGLRYFNSAVKEESYDVIFVFAPSPITAVIPALYLRWKLKTHLAVWVQDLWPESLRATGFIQNKALLYLIGWLVRSIYARTDSLLVQSRAFIKPITKYVPRDKIIYFPNIYRDIFMESSPIERNIPVELVNLYNDFFCITFAGNMGVAQSLNTILLAAEKLKYIKNLRIVFVGSGSMSNWLIEQKKNRDLENVIIAGRYPSECMPEIYRLSKALIVTLKKKEVFSFTVPGKVQSYLAAGRPIIAAMDGEGARVIEDAGAGLTCGAEDVKGLVCCVDRLYSMSSIDIDKLSQSARAYYLKNFELSVQTKKLIEILAHRINR